MLGGKIIVKQVDAFTDTPLFGNPAGVVIDANGMNEELMQAMAREVNVSETAFVLDSDVADFKVRFLTPSGEVDLCGHATIGTFFALVEVGRITLDSDCVTVHQETRAGILPVDIYSIAGRLEKIMMTQASPRFRDFTSHEEEVAGILRIPEPQIRATSCPIELAYTGLWHLIVPVQGLEYVQEMKPDRGKLLDFSRKHAFDTVHLFTLETVESESSVHTRDFAPVYADTVVEDPATGTASGALGAYLVKNGIMEPEDNLLALVSEQGYEIGRALH
jgi:trans-2,3-dihydro-3-hydroxyanthranilate isomerase